MTKRKTDTAVESAVPRLEKLRDSGIKVIVDAAEWFKNAKNLAKAHAGFPLTSQISPQRADCVVEALHIAAMMNRPRKAPSGTIYAHSNEELKHAFDKLVKYVFKMTENHDGEHEQSERVGDEHGSESSDSDESSKADPRSVRAESEKA